MKKKVPKLATARQESNFDHSVCNIHEDQNLISNEAGASFRTFNEKQLYNYAIWLLGRRRYHSAELRQKLEKRSTRFAASNLSEDDAVTLASPTMISAIIDKLTGYGFLNDEEYVKLFIEDHISRKAQGPRLIRQKLLRKGIDSTQIAIHLSHASIDQLKLANKAAEKRIRSLKTDDPSSIAKLTRFLHGRGFDFAIIKQVLNSVREHQTQ